MKILPIANHSAKRLWALPILRRCPMFSAADTFEKTLKPMPKLEAITLETVNKMYGANFVPKDKACGEFIYPTFVLDKKTSKPVEVFVRPVNVDDYEEVYHIMDKTQSKIIGIRTFKVGKYEEVIDSGYMQAYSHDYEGIGLRAHQIAIERMFMRNYDNVNIVAVPSSFNFHKAAGFFTITDKIKLDKDFYKKIIARLCKDYNISENKVKDMMVADCSSDIVTLEKYTSYENLLKYIYSLNDPDLIKECPLSLYMHLSENAKSDWKKLIDMSPIFIGKKFPEQVVRPSY